MSSRAGFDAAADLVPIQPWHLHVQENHIWRLYLHVLEGGSTVADETDIAIETGQVRFDELAIGQAVVNYKYDRHSLPASPAVKCRHGANIVRARA
jgi:hypothetical protein